MEMLKKFFPFSFVEKKDVVALIINIIIQIVLSAVIGLIISICAKIPVLGWIIGLAGGLVGLYFLVGIVLSCLDYFKILK